MKSQREQLTLRLGAMSEKQDGSEVKTRRSGTVIRYLTAKSNSFGGRVVVIPYELAYQNATG